MAEIAIQMFTQPDGTIVYRTVNTETGQYGWSAPQAAPDPTKNPYYDNLIKTIQENQQYTREQSAQDYQLKLDQLKNQRDQIAISSGTAAANEWYQKQQVKLAREAQALKVADTTGYYQGDPTFARQQWQANATGYLDGNPTFAREQYQTDTGLKVLDRAIELGNRPGDWFKYLQYAGGAQPTASTLPFIQNLAAGRPAAAVTAWSGPNGTQDNLASTAQTLMSGTTGSQYGSQQALEALRNYGRNPQTIPGGWYESLSPTQRDFVHGAWQADQQDLGTVLDRLSKSRVSQGNALGA